MLLYLYTQPMQLVSDYLEIGEHRIPQTAAYLHVRIAIARSGGAYIRTHRVLTRFGTNVLSIEPDLTQQWNRSVRCVPHVELNDHDLTRPHAVRFVHDVEVHVIVRVVLSQECLGKEGTGHDNKEAFGQLRHAHLPQMPAPGRKR